MSIYDNLARLRERVEAAARRAGRDASEIKIVAVTKTVHPDSINEAVACGITDLGENRVQELLSKYDAVTGAQWHLIGHLQTNKVKYIIDKVNLIHSVDSAELVQEISKRASAAGITANMLLQVNISGEESKFGISPQGLDELLEITSGLGNIMVKGLMTIAPFETDLEKIRPHFRNLYKKFIDIGQKKYHNIDMSFLSMGMSGDFETAIEEGANIIRVGTAIFGSR